MVLDLSLYIHYYIQIKAQTKQTLFALKLLVRIENDIVKYFYFIQKKLIYAKRNETKRLKKNECTNTEYCYTLYLL